MATRMLRSETGGASRRTRADPASGAVHADRLCLYAVPVGCVSVCDDDFDVRFADRGPWLSGMLVIGESLATRASDACSCTKPTSRAAFGASGLWLYTGEAAAFYNERCGWNVVPVRNSCRGQRDAQGSGRSRAPIDAAVATSRGAKAAVGEHLAAGLALRAVHDLVRLVRDPLQVVAAHRARQPGLAVHGEVLAELVRDSPPLGSARSSPSSSNTQPNQ